MRRFYYLAASIVLLVACSGLEQPEQDLFMDMEGDLVEKVVFEVLPIKDGDDPETRASAVPTGSGVSFAWEESDMIGIYPNKGSQIYFTIEDGAGSSSASFDGGGWALKQNASYISYYPFVADYFLDRTKIPVSFSGQKQVGTEPPFNGARYFLASAATSSEKGVLKFTYNTLNTIINVNATLPAGTYTKMSLTTEEPLFVEEGTYSLDDRIIVGTKFTNTLEIELEDVILTEQATIPIYIMSAPVDLQGKYVIVCFSAADGRRYKCIKTPSRAYEAGTRYGLNCKQMENENNVILYTSADGSIVAPYKTDVFGADIVSNEYINGLGVIVFDKDVTSIGDWAFGYCSNLTSIDIPNSVTSIGEYAFRECTSLSSVTIPESTTSIGNSAFFQCISLASFGGKYSTSDGLYLIDQAIIIAAAIGSISGSISLPSSVKGIGDFAFYGCGGLTAIAIPEGVTYIGQYAFRECSNLTSVSLPEGLTHIGSYAFHGCESIGSITLPKSVTYIGSYAFLDCSNLSRIIVLCDTPPMVAGDLFDDTSDCPIYVPAESVDAYKSTQYWSDYADRINALAPLPEAVDLGLSVKWASFNLGASAPEEYGDYYAWGETEPKDDYSWETYKWCMGSNTTLTKYCDKTDRGYEGFTDDKTVLDLDDDAAHVNLGGSWRMPTDAEMTELRENCTWAWTTLNGVNGGLATGPNGNSIFLPAAGKWNSTDLFFAGSYGFVLSSSLATDSTSYASDIYLSSSIIDRSGDFRCLGISVRPVFAKE
jgi:hypothetical protein